MKKILTLALMIALLGTALTGATLAFFTDSVTADNVVVSGNIEILQHEQERSGNTLVPYTQGKSLAPLVQNGAKGYEELTLVGHTFRLPDANTRNFVDKIVTVSNVGVNPAYVRTFIAVPTAGHISDSPEADNWLRWDRNTDTWDWGREGWDLVDDAVIGGKTYDIYVATYTTALAPGETTAPSLLGFWLDSAVTCSGNQYYFTTAQGQRIGLGDISAIEILVATQAVQTTTFDDPWTALDTVFGAASADNNPWINAATTYVSSDAELAEALAGASSGSTIRLADGTYTLPQKLPAGIRIVGHGAGITVTAPDSLYASGVEFFNLTFANAVNFSGNGEFDQVTFRAAFRAEFDNPAYITDCVFESGCDWTVTEDAVRDTVIFENCTGYTP